jgi:hypothetical protein
MGDAVTGIKAKRRTYRSKTNVWGPDCWTQSDIKRTLREVLFICAIFGTAGQQMRLMLDSPK